MRTRAWEKRLNGYETEWINWGVINRTKLNWLKQNNIGDDKFTYSYAGWQFLVLAQQFPASINSSAKLLLLYWHTHTLTHTLLTYFILTHLSAIFSLIFQKNVYISCLKSGDITSVILNVKHNGKWHLCHLIPLLITLNSFLNFIRTPWENSVQRVD